MTQCRTENENMVSTKIQILDFGRRFPEMWQILISQRSLSYDRPIASTTVSSPYGKIWCFLFQYLVFFFISLRPFSSRLRLLPRFPVTSKQYTVSFFKFCYPFFSLSLTSGCLLLLPPPFCHLSATHCFIFQIQVSFQFRKFNQ